MLGDGAVEVRFPRLYAAASLKHHHAGDRRRLLRRFPRLYAAASLKPPGAAAPRRGHRRGFPRLYAAASLKLPGAGAHGGAAREFSAALCRGLIEACRPDARPVHTGRFSAALCRGLIEAASVPRSPNTGPSSFPRLYAAASLKPAEPARGVRIGRQVFRGFMPRPH